MDSNLRYLIVLSSKKNCATSYGGKLQEARQYYVGIEKFARERSRARSMLVIIVFNRIDCGGCSLDISESQKP